MVADAVQTGSDFRAVMTPNANGAASEANAASRRQR
jgi:hypothetical protein